MIYILYMSNVLTRLTPKHYIKPHSMGVKRKPVFISPGVYTQERDISFMRIPVAYEPMVQHRYVMNIHDHNRGIQSFFVRLGTSRPQIQTTEDILVPRYGTRGYGRMEWQPLEIKIIDTIGENSSENYFRDWMTEGFNPNDDRMGLAIDYKKHIELTKLDPVGSVIEKWALTGAQIQMLNHELVYDQTRGDIEITIIYDNAHIIY